MLSVVVDVTLTVVVVVVMVVVLEFGVRDTLALVVSKFSVIVGTVGVFVVTVVTGADDVVGLN